MLERGTEQKKEEDRQDRTITKVSGYLRVSLKVVELEQGAVELWEKGHDQGAVILPAKIWKWDYACVCVCWKQ